MERSSPPPRSAPAMADQFAVDPDDEPTGRERLATLVERRLDIPMALLAVVWFALVAYELVAPADQRGELALAGNIIWGVFVVEFLARLVVSGKPVRYAARHWFSILILLLPALRLVRVFQALRLVRILPVARVVGSSYRAVGTARNLLQGRLVLLLVVSGVVVFGGGQLLYVLERAREGGVSSLGEALYWSASIALTNTRVFEPVTAPGRLLTLLMSLYATVIVAAIAATLGAYLIEARAELAAADDRRDDEADAGEATTRPPTTRPPTTRPPTTRPGPPMAQGPE